MNWRREYPVLVFDAHTIGGVAIIRSLGRAGYPVHACSAYDNAIGLSSNFAYATAVCPAYELPEFIPWLREYTNKHQIKAITPSEGVLIALRQIFFEFAHLFPLRQNEETVYQALSKFDLFRFLQHHSFSSEIADHMPTTLIVDYTSRLPDAKELEKLGFPLHIKVDGIHGKAQNNSAIFTVFSLDETYKKLRLIASRYTRVLVQEDVPGCGVGAFFLLWDGKVVAEFMHRRLHEVPHTGGASSLRESWFHSGIRNDAIAKLMKLNWQGVAMMEYRWNKATGDFYLLEMNARFWGSLHLALWAGVDFPRLLLDVFHGRVLEPVTEYPMGIRCRYTFPKEVQYVWSRLKDKRVSPLQSFWSILEFFLLMFNHRIKSDLFFPGDRGLYWKSLKRFLTTLS